MKIISVLFGDVYGFPPVLSLLHAFEELDIQSILITTNSKKNLKEEFPNTQIEQLSINYEEIKKPIDKMLYLLHWRAMTWNLINKHYTDDSIIWVVTDVTVKILGKQLTSKRYILHLLELSENITYYSKLSFLKFDRELLGNKAKAIIVPEYNRAHIIKTWWKLNKLPYVLPNKPYVAQKIEKNNFITDKKAKMKLLKKLETRK